jgi:hypothetical protein
MFINLSIIIIIGSSRDWTQGLILALPLEPLHQSFLVLGLTNYLPGLASNLDLPDLCLLSS